MMQLATPSITAAGQTMTTATTTDSGDPPPSPTVVCSNSNSNISASNSNLNQQHQQQQNSSSDSLRGGGGGGGGRTAATRSMQHPNIHHHPVIHPHHRYNHQRAASSSASPSSSASTPTSATMMMMMMPMMTSSSSTSANLSSSASAFDNPNPNANNNSNEYLSSPPPPPPPPPRPSPPQPHRLSATPIDQFDIDQIDPVEKLRKVESQLIRLQEGINKLNHEIFKDPQNHTRPPPEYLDGYNCLTASLHDLQQEKEKLEAMIKARDEQQHQQQLHAMMINRSHNDSNNSLFESSPFDDSNNAVGGGGGDHLDGVGFVVSPRTSASSPQNNNINAQHIHHNYYNNNNAQPSTTPPSTSLSCSPSKYSSSLNNHPNNTNNNNDDHLADLNSHRKQQPPTSLTAKNNNLPRFKLDHPTTLITNPSQSANTIIANNNNNNTTASSPSPPSNTSPPTTYRGGTFAQPPNISASNSPATTPTFHSARKQHVYPYYHPQQQQQPPQQPDNSPPQQQQQQQPMSTSTSTISLPSSAQATTPTFPSGAIQLNSNGLISYNRSFGDISEVSPTTNYSSSSVATTPTPSASSSISLPSSFFRVYIGTSTAVVEKKPIMLKEALASKLKSRNMDVEKCIAYTKDSNYKIEWDFDVSKLNVDQIVVAEISDEIRHRFEKKTFTLRSCDSCKKRYLLNVYACSKCDYVMCQRNECRTRSERIVCASGGGGGGGGGSGRDRRDDSSGAGSVGSIGSGGGYSAFDPTAASKLGKPSEVDVFGRPESPNRDMSINISQQILPVHQLRVSIPPRDRSRSETELNMFGNNKLITDTTRPVPKSPSTSAKPIFGTLPRNNNIINNNPSINNNTPSVIMGSNNNNSNNNNNNANPVIKTSTSVVISSTTQPPTTTTMITPTTIVAAGGAVDDISGSVNEESGSVQGLVPRDKLLKPEIRRTIKQSKPNRRDSFNSWEIPFKQIKKVDQKVGSGSFGIVHQARDFYHGVVAIKFLNVQNPTPTQAQAFRNEVAILKSLRHDCILLFIGCVLKPVLAIVTEWCPGSSLYRHLHVEEEHWDVNQLIEIGKQTAIGMEYLHACNILHRDLKSNNIFLIPKEVNPPGGAGAYPGGKLNGTNRSRLNELLSSGGDSQVIAPKWSVKIGDFGLATVKTSWTQSSARTNQPTGSILWMAPEVITQKVNDPYTQKSDVYSYGVVLYELFTGLLPYEHKEQNAILFLVGSGRLKPKPDDLRADTPQEIKDLMMACCQFDRNKRYDFVEINDRLRKTKVVRVRSNRPERSRSLPCLTFVSSNMYDDEMIMYPSTPNPTSSINSPQLQFEADFNDSQQQQQQQHRISFLTAPNNNRHSNNSDDATITNF